MAKYFMPHFHLCTSWSTTTCNFSLSRYTHCCSNVVANTQASGDHFFQQGITVKNQVLSCNMICWLSPHPLKSCWLQYKGNAPRRMHQLKTLGGGSSDPLNRPFRATANASIWKVCWELSYSFVRAWKLNQGGTPSRSAYWLLSRFIHFRHAFALLSMNTLNVQWSYA